LIVFAVCCGLPLGWLLVQLVSYPVAWAEFWVDEYRLNLIGRTILFNGSAALVAMALATPVALMLGRGRGLLATLCWIVLPVSLLIPSIVFGYGWKQALRLGGIDLEPAGIADIARCIWTLGTWLWPIPAAAAGLVLRRTDWQIQQQAMLDGAQARITLRLMLPTLLAAGCVCAAMAMAEFAVYEPTGISVISTEVRAVFETGAWSTSSRSMIDIVGGSGIGSDTLDQRARAAAAFVTAMPMLIVIVLLVIFSLWQLRRANHEEPIDASPWPKSLEPAPLTRVLAALVIVVALGVPLGSLVLSMKRAPDLELWWAQLSPQTLGSMFVSSLTGLIGMCLAILGLSRRERFALPLAIATFLVGGELLAIAQIRIYNRPWLAWAYGAAPVVIVTHLALFGWIALLAARWTHGGAWRELRELASIDGASPLQAAWRVVLPLSLPLLVAAAVVIMMLSFGEVPATLLLYPQNPQMLTPTMMGWVHMLRYDAMIEASLMVVGLALFVSATVVCLFAVLRKKLKIQDLKLKIGDSVSPRVRGLKSLIVILQSSFLIFLAGCDRLPAPESIWLETGTGPGQVIYPRAIAFSKFDNTFVVIDRLARVQRLDAQGRPINGWRMPEWKTGKPVGVSVGPDGRIYIADTHYHRVVVYSTAGELLRQWGSFGNAPGEFVYPTDVAFDDAGKIFVAEYGDHDRIQIFDADGKYQSEIGSFGTGDGQFIRPQSIVIDQNLLYVSDACNHRIVVFTTAGKWLRNLGGVGAGPGQFRFPYGLEMDHEGMLVVTEFGNNRIQRIDPTTGRGLGTWGAAGRNEGQLAYPWSAAVDAKDRVVAVDSGNNRLQVFRF